MYDPFKRDAFANLRDSFTVSKALFARFILFLFVFAFNHPQNSFYEVFFFQLRPVKIPDYWEKILNNDQCTCSVCKCTTSHDCCRIYILYIVAIIMWLCLFSLYIR